MNKYKRKRITEAVILLEDASAIVSEVNEEEESCFQNMPESLQSSPNGIAMEEAVSEMNDAISSIGDAIDSLNNIN